MPKFIPPRVLKEREGRKENTNQNEFERRLLIGLDISRCMHVMIRGPTYNNDRPTELRYKVTAGGKLRLQSVASICS